ncbi:MAG: peptidoglycan recognition protein family protein [Lachnospiraceae bacterium]|nr:peptidoglycan recognition protein family protein [Lachnospiraceae bacterium]
MTRKKMRKGSGRRANSSRKAAGRSAATGTRQSGTARSGSEHHKASGGSGKRKKKTGMRRLRVWLNRVLAVVLFIAFLALLIWGFSRLLGVLNGGEKNSTVNYDELPDYVTEDYLTVNPYSRPGISLSEVNGIVIHYTANPGSTAQQNRDYFEGLAESGETRASSHFVIGIDGEVIACVPLGELAYASNSRNKDTIAIECCHEDETGEFSQATYDSLVKLTVWLCGKYDLDSEDVIRHYDITGKSCPKYYVDNPDAWTAFLSDVADGLQ